MCKPDTFSEAIQYSVMPSFSLAIASGNLDLIFGTISEVISFLLLTEWLERTGAQISLLSSLYIIRYRSLSGKWQNIKTRNILRVSGFNATNATNATKATNDRRFL
jgi:hypothetical protein